MAALKVIKEQPERIELGKGGGGGGALIGVVIFGAVTCIALSAILDEGGGPDPVMIVIFLVIGLAVLSSAANAISSTRVVLDANQRSATRKQTFFFIPTRRQEMAFNLIRDVQVTRAGSLTMDSFPIWQVELHATDGSTLVVNDRGTRAEMDALAEKVGALLNRPVRAQEEIKKQSTETNYTPASVMTALVENLAAFAQSAAPASLAPTVSAFPDSTPRLQQDAVERAPRGQRKLRAPTPPAPPNTFSPTTTMVNPDAPFLEASADLAAQQSVFETTSAFNASPVVYSAPPVLVMPQLPGMMSFGPAMELPSFPALGLGMEMPAPTIPDSQEYKTVQAEISPSANTPSENAEARAARQMYTNRNFREAQAAYTRVLSANPADASAQNDLGVVYFEQNKMTDAERAFRRALALDPFSNASRYNLGLVLSRLGKRNDAYEQFKVGAQNASRDDAAYFQEALRGILGAPLLSPSPESRSMN